MYIKFKEENKMMKVRCTGYKQNYEKFFTVGKIYNVSDKGKITNDNGFIK